ncbi:MAG: hypothetical protein KC877_04845 [Candidatus Kaiserbacteria bacterium]|nr:hypothetical protein [Candidatus Kaiserbacteria bacterium]MCB9816891.1 hypothetical protein [Candidatus Nomurabacteria bacterium]
MNNPEPEFPAPEFHAQTGGTWKIYAIKLPAHTKLRPYDVIARRGGGWMFFKEKQRLGTTTIRVPEDEHWYRMV